MIDRSHSTPPDDETPDVPSTNDELPENVPPARPRASGPGGILRAAREAQSFTREEVADALHLLPRVIEDLEDENWQRLQNATFTRGYYRAYAKLMEVDVERVLEAYRAAAPGRDGDAAQPGARRTARSGGRAPSRSGPLLPIVIVVVIVAALALAAWWYWSGGDERAGTQPVRTPAAQAAREPAVTAPASVRGRAVAEQPEPAPATTVTPPPVPESVRQLESSPAPAELTAQEADDLAAPLAPGEDEGGAAEPVEAAGPEFERITRRLTPDGDDRLVFRFHEDCWVRIASADGESLYSMLGRAGEEHVLLGSGPFRLVIGNAPAVDLTFNDEPVALRAQARNNVASLTLGR